MTTITNDDAWSCYWQHQGLESCVANNANDKQIATKQWHQFIEPLAANSHLLDLATGNGSVLHCIAQKRPDLYLTGVDYAAISPSTHFSESQLINIQFVSHTDITKLPFEHESFDAITSQFGFEYADTLLTIKEIERVLKSNGRFQLIIHHHNSEVLTSSSKKHHELGQLFESIPLLDYLEQTIKNEISLSTLENYQRQYVEKYQSQVTEQVTGQIMRGIRHIATQQQDQDAIQELFNNFKQQIAADLSRLGQLKKAAKSEQGIIELTQKMKEQFKEVSYELVTQPHDLKRIFSWKISGVK